MDISFVIPWAILPSIIMHITRSTDSENTIIGQFPCEIIATCSACRTTCYSYAGNQRKKKCKKFFHIKTILLDCRFRTTREYKKKAWNLIFAYSPTCGTGKNLVSKNKQLTPTPEYECHQTEPSRRMLCRRDSHIPKGVYCLLVRADENFRFSGCQNKR